VLASSVQTLRLQAICHSSDQYYWYYSKSPRNGEIKLYPAALEVPKLLML
jgi:hypothetical protein